MKYNINIDQLVKIWQNLSVTVDFDVTEEELLGESLKNFMKISAR